MKRATLPFLAVMSFLFSTMLAYAQYTFQLVRNGDFESDMASWSYVSRGNAKGSVRLTTDIPLNDKSPHSLRLEVNNLGEVCGIANDGGGGINVRSDEWYEGTFFARKADGAGVGLVFSLETMDGKTICARTTLPEIGRGGIGVEVEGNNQWRKYTVSLHARSSESKCRLVIYPVEPATVYFDEISLKPRNPQSQDVKRIDR